MSKHLIKTQGEIYLNPFNIYDLKRDLLLYDKLGMLNLQEILKGLYEYRSYPVFQNALNELEFLIAKDLFIDLIQLAAPFAERGTALINTDDLGLADLTMKLKTQMSEEKDEKKRDKLYWKHDELNTRLFCNIVNDNNKAVFTVPSLADISSFELHDTVKQKAYTIIHKLIPLPTDDTSWEKILDFKNDEESILKLLALKNWMLGLSENMSAHELEDKIRYLSCQYSDSLKRHKIKSRFITYKSVINTIPSALSELIRFRFDRALNAFFNVAEQQVNFTKEEDDLKGKELAYISMVNSKFGKKK